MAVAQDEFALVPVQKMGLERIVELVEKAELFEDWLKGLRSYLHEAAMRGEKVPGYKLVPKRGQRQWAREPKEVAEHMALLIGEDEMYAERELLSVAQMEKVVGKGNVPPNLYATVSSGYNLVKESNPLPEITLHPGDDFVAIQPESTNGK